MLMMLILLKMVKYSDIESDTESDTESAVESDTELEDLSVKKFSYFPK